MSIELKMNERLSARLSKNLEGSAAFDPMTIATLITTIFSAFANCRDRNTPTDETPEGQVARMRQMSDRQQRRIFKARLINDNFEGKAKAWRKGGGREQLEAAMSEFNSATDAELVEAVIAARAEQALIES